MCSAMQTLNSGSMMRKLYWSDLGWFFAKFCKSGHFIRNSLELSGCCLLLRDILAKGTWFSRESQTCEMVTGKMRLGTRVSNTGIVSQSSWHWPVPLCRSKVVQGPHKTAAAGVQHGAINLAGVLKTPVETYGVGTAWTLRWDYPHSIKTDSALPAPSVSVTPIWAGGWGLRAQWIGNEMWCLSLQ